MEHLFCGKTANFDYKNVNKTGSKDPIFKF